MKTECGIKLDVQDLSLRFADKTVLQNINLRIPEHKITAFIGPSGCGITGWA